MADQSMALAGQSLLLATHALGLDARWMRAPLFCPDMANAKLDWPADWLPLALVAVGYAVGERRKERFTLTTRVRFLDQRVKVPFRTT